jgi:Methyltransferase domain
MSFYTNFIENDNHLGCRFPTFRIAFGLLDIDKKNNFVETGTTRKNKISHSCKFDRGGDGCSTVLFGDYVKKYGGHVWTCDISRDNIESCKIATEHCKENITYVVDDSLNFLKNFNDKIDFLYLDSLDGNLPNCADHQLNEVILSEDKLHDHSVILLDDIGTKTALSIPYLRQKGWVQIELSNNPESIAQAVFVHRNNLFSHLK